MGEITGERVGHRLKCIAVVDGAVAHRKQAVAALQTSYRVLDFGTTVQAICDLSGTLSDLIIVDELVQPHDCREFVAGGHTRCSGECSSRRLRPIPFACVGLPGFGKPVLSAMLVTGSVLIHGEARLVSVGLAGCAPERLGFAALCAAAAHGDRGVRLGGGRSGIARRRCHRSGDGGRSIGT